MQINRLFETIYILLEKERVTASELAKRFEVSVRTIYRDIETLSAAGIPIYMTKGSGGGISILPGFVLNKTVLTDEEKADILSSLQTIEAVSLDKTDTALKKLSALFGEVNTDWVEVDFSSWDNNEDEVKLFVSLKQAVLGKKLVSFLYHSGSGNSIKRTVAPLKLCFKGQGWYLYGFCNLREDYRFFKLRRMKELLILEEQHKQLAPQTLFRKPDVFRGEMVELKLKFSKDMAFRVYDEFSKIETLSDGSFIVKQVVPKGEWIYSYLSSFGAHCEVLAPPEIRMDIIENLQKNLNQYL